MMKLYIENRIGDDAVEKSCFACALIFAELKIRQEKNEKQVN